MKSLNNYITESQDKLSFIDKLKKNLKKIKLGQKQEKNDLEKFADNNINKKFQNAWTLVITKTDMCLKPEDIVIKYYYVIDEKDSLEANKSIAHNLWSEGDFGIQAYEITTKNPKYDPNAFEDGTSAKTGEKIDNFEPSMIWQALSYLFELDCNYSAEALIRRTKSQESKGYDKPKKLNSLDELKSLWKKVEDLYRKKEKETEDFLDTPLDKIDDFKFLIKPEDIDI